MPVKYQELHLAIFSIVCNNALQYFWCFQLNMHVSTFVVEGDFLQSLQNVEQCMRLCVCVCVTEYRSVVREDHNQMMEI